MTRTSLPTCFKIDGQIFRFVGTTDHWTANDRYLELVIYDAVCAHPGCRRVFRYKTTKTNWRRHLVNRRCSEHKAPGVPVPKRQSRKRVKSNRTPVQRLDRGRTGLSTPAGAPSAPRPSYLD
jgi:hypothetical protein